MSSHDLLAHSRIQQWPGRRVWVGSIEPQNLGVVVSVDVSLEEDPYALVRFDDGAIASVPAADEGKRWGFEDRI